MWADSLQIAEQHYLIRLFIWSEASVLVGGAVLSIVLWRRMQSPMVAHFAIQTAGWGAVELGIAFLKWKSLAPRDHAAAVQLDRMVWLNIGLDAGYVALGVALVACGWLLGRRLALVGAGAAIIVQGLALASLEILLAQQILR